MAKIEKGRADIMLADPVTGESTVFVGEIDVTVHQTTNGRGRKRAQRDRSHAMWGLVDNERLGMTRLTGIEYRVLWTIAGQASVEDNIARIGPSEIADKIGSSATVVSRAIAELRDRRFIFSEGRTKWMPTPWLFYRGSVADWEEVTTQFEEPIYDAELASV